MQRCRAAALPGHLPTDFLAGLSYEFFGADDSLGGKALLDTFDHTHAVAFVGRTLIAYYLSKLAEPGLTRDHE
ncbi:MAG TPA: hypothetical protein VK636_17600 [Gemmatimonadaceae bacterium]|nr:hypothetical protein [Gemmatimonadaceae bacterium]